ncbi:MAG: sugar transferase [Lentisphaerae bacterium]|nr:MAG: sugar transferase [Lentisphaerota bacterium]
MISHNIERRQWVLTAIRMFTDILLTLFGSSLAIWLRFQADWGEPVIKYGWAFLISGIVCGTLIYICGLYTSTRPLAIRRLALTLLIITTISNLLTIFLTYAVWIKPIGRGGFLLAFIANYLLLLQHHILLHAFFRRARDRAIILIGSARDQLFAQHLVSDLHPYIDFVGWVLVNNYVINSECEAPILGTTADIEKLIEQYHIDRVVCSHERLSDQTLTHVFCRLRYSGVAVILMVLLYEEFHRMCPLALLSSQWLLHASSAPQLTYIRSLKRIFDITAAITIGMILMPFFIFAVILQLILHGRPVFYRQKRLGRGGKEFYLYKIRTMITDAEKNGIQWSSGDGDPRVTALGRILRKFRIDEIPQLLNVLRGDMSFVGPRPERPELTEQLAQQVPFFLERLLVQPGLTGWAQVSYPYGASVQDAWRKLEYDLYYIKHMSLFFDLFIILDTIRIVLFGGAKAAPSSSISTFQLQSLQEIAPSQ